MGNHCLVRMAFPVCRRCRWGCFLCKKINILSTIYNWGKTTYGGQYLHTTSVMWALWHHVIPQPSRRVEPHPTLEKGVSNRVSNEVNMTIKIRDWRKVRSSGMGKPRLARAKKSDLPEKSRPGVETSSERQNLHPKKHCDAFFLKKFVIIFWAVDNDIIKWIWSNEFESDVW